MDSGLDAEIDLLPVPFAELGLVVERVHLADAAVHEELDDAADAGTVVQAAVELGTRGVGQGAVLAEEMGQGQGAEAGPGRGSGGGRWQGDSWFALPTRLGERGALAPR